MRVRVAEFFEARPLTGIINTAFQVEKFFIDTDRIDVAQVEDFFAKGCFLVAEDEAGLAACVYVEQRNASGYFGLLSVLPDRQKMGLGRTLVEAAEQHCRALGCSAMDLQIVNLRQELPAFYRRLGYTESGTGEFPPDVVTKLPCHFVRMSKAL
ncbi:MAG TPA: GNAT family N-acetyltransferase [Candidatus Sulfopaludibacter sp.]|jgi:GNAT superfamily N-acetyltransferase|nr:GNAT family N-acetyltransferase [Candidatus Sulfopaludibacter sp.]